MNEDIVVVLSVISLGAFVASLRFLRRYLEMRHERVMRTPAAELADFTARLERIESTVETTALEVERIAEANRFMARLLAESKQPILQPARQERVITPH